MKSKSAAVRCGFSFTEPDLRGLEADWYTAKLVSHDFFFH